MLGLTRCLCSPMQVPVEAERVVDNDLILEQFLSPVSPLLSGFRLDAFSVIKPRVTHSPSSDGSTYDASITYLEDRHISPAVLYIQVSALQVFTISRRLNFKINHLVCYTGPSSFFS